MPMNLILLERVPKLGQMGDVVKVKPGFARNYLLPQKKALRATKDNITYFESQRKVLEAQNLERRGEAEAVAGKMKDVKVTHHPPGLRGAAAVRFGHVARHLRCRQCCRRQDRAQPGRARQADQDARRPPDPDPPPSRGRGRDHRADRPLGRRGRVPRQGRQAGRRERARCPGGGRSGTAHGRSGGCPVRSQDGRRRRRVRRGCDSDRARAGRREIARPSLGPASASNACRRPATACVFA